MNAGVQSPRVLESLEIEELRTVPDLRPLVEEWQPLWVRSGRTPFQSPLWLLPWIEKFTGDNLRVLVCRRGGELILVAAFYTWPEGTDARLLLAGNGLSDYLDICADPKYECAIRDGLSD